MKQEERGYENLFLLFVYDANILAVFIFSDRLHEVNYSYPY